MNKSKFSLIALIVIIIASFFYFDLAKYLSFEYLKEQKGALEQLYSTKPLLITTGYFLIYILVTALSLPGAAIMTLAGGAIFGLLKGTILVSFASSIGATFAFLASRFLLKESIQNKFGDRLKTINQGIEKEGAFYLFTLRLIPAFPFFVVNLLMGLTSIKTFTYFFVSQLGMLAGTIVYVNAGTQLAKIDSLGAILSPNLILSFIVLGLFPIIVKKLLSILKPKKAA